MKKIILALLCFPAIVFAQIVNPSAPATAQTFSPSSTYPSGTVGNQLVNTPPGYVHVFPQKGQTTGANFKAVDPYASNVTCTGTVTQCLQESITQAFLTSSGNGYDFWLDGGNTAYASGVIQSPTSLTLPVSQNKFFHAGGTTLNVNSSAGSAAAMVINSSEMLDFDLAGGQIVYQGTGPSLVFKPTNPTPQDLLYGIVDSDFHFTTVPPISFDWTGNTGAFAEANWMDFGEVNYSNALNGSPTSTAFYVPSPSSSQNFGYNFIRSRHVHGTIGTGTLWKVGNGTSAAADFGKNMYQLNLFPDSSTAANGIDTWESNSLYLANIGRITTGIPVKLESGACNNIFIIPYNSNPSGNVDSSGCVNNIWITQGSISVGPNASMTGTGFSLANTIATSTINAPVNFTFTNNYSSTANGVEGISLSPTMTSVGATSGNVSAIYATPTIGASANSITTARGMYLDPIVASGYTGTIGTFSAMEINPTNNSSTNPVTFSDLRLDAIANGNGATSGTINNSQLYFSGSTASGASGSTLTNYGIYMGLGVGSTAQTSNIGIYIAGNGSPTAGSNYAIDSASTAPSTFTGHVNYSVGSTPTIASGACGTGTNGTISGNDQSGKITIGSSATTACAVTFSTNVWASAPTSCVVTAASAASAATTVLPYISALSASGFTLSGSALASTSFYYHCE